MDIQVYLDIQIYLDIQVYWDGLRVYWKPQESSHIRDFSESSAR